MPTDLPVLTVRDVTEWADWLSANVSSEGVRLVLAKKGVTEPTSLSYDEALDEALCHGWIDGRRDRRDESTFLQRFTPRRRASIWSQRNVDKVGRLVRDGRMRPAGQAEIDRAKADGRWERAYAGPATAEVPPDLAAAFVVHPTAAANYAELDSTNRFAIIFRINQAKRPETRERRVTQFVEMLERGESLHPRRGRGTTT